MKGTRVGGSLAGFVEDARAALACDPYDKYPKKDGNIICLGYGEPHVGRVIHRLLFRPGAFTIIQDEKTKDWRVFRPWSRDEQRGGDYGDQGREKETMPAPPLIPARRIKGKIAWVKRAHHIFHRVDLDTGWSIYAANSAGDPKQVQGFDVHLYHIDEDLATNGWYLEASSRTQMVEGKLRWTALPHGENDDLLNLVKRAEEQQDNPDKISVVLRATMYDNPYMSDKSKKELEVLWRSAGEDVYRQRALGQLSTESTKMYPTFNTRIHGYKAQSTAICKALQARSGQVPEGWCRYMIVDPGHTICAVMFVAVPPPSSGDHVYIYDECYIPQATAAMYGATIEPKTKVAAFQAFIIDAHGGALRELGSGLTPREQYSSQMLQRGISSVETRSEFLSGCDHMEGRENALREWLRIREDGSTKLIVNVEQCPNFCREMESFKKRYVVNNGQRIILNEGNRRAGTHLVECFTGDTEVLASDGWKRWDCVGASDVLATISSEGVMEYQTPTRIVRREHHGEMVHFSGRSQDWVVTPGHRMLCRSQGAARDGLFDFRFRDASEVVSSDELLLAPFAWNGERREMVAVDKTYSKNGSLTSDELHIDPELYAEFMGWFVSEGCATTKPRCPGHGYRVFIAQIKEPNRTLLELFLKQLPWKFIPSGHGFVASSKQLWEQVSPLGKSWDKYVPQWIMESEPKVILAFLRGYLMGDGWHQANTVRCGTASRRLADQIQELLLKMGYGSNLLTRTDQIGRVNIRKSDGKEFTGRRPVYWVSQLKRKTRGLRQSDGSPTFRNVQYDGMVYCATVPNSTLIVRRNGKPLVVGNCGEYSAAHGCVYVAPPKSLSTKSWVDRMLEEEKSRKARFRVINGVGADRATINLGPRGTT